MEIRKLNADTWQDAAGLFDQYRVFYEKASDPELAKAFIKARVSNNESVIFAAYSDSNEPVGFTQLYPSFSSVSVVKMWILNDLYVKPEHRKTGAGKKLMEQAIAFAKDDKAVSISLETGKDNLVAKALYEKTGFKLNSGESAYDSYTLTL